MIQRHAHFHKFALSLLSILLIFSHRSFAFMEFAESGDITPRGTLKVGAGPQIRLSDGTGVNVTGYLESGFREDLSWRVHLGAGETDFAVGGSVKWIPIPDYENQPAIGGRVDLEVGSKSNNTISVFRVAPLVSKGFQTDYVFFTPYAALPLGISGSRGTSDFFTQLALGSDIKVDDWKNIVLNAELGANITKAFSYVSLNFFYFFDAKDGIKVRRSR